LIIGDVGVSDGNDEDVEIGKAYKLQKKEWLLHRWIYLCFDIKLNEFFWWIIMTYFHNSI